jgi:signal transduction histidine kinase
MVLRKRISYGWRIFVPLLLALWTVIIGLSWWQIKRETDYQRTFVETQLELVNHGVMDAINSEDPEYLQFFLRFVDKFYHDNKFFGAVRITLFDNNWNVIQSVGEPIVLTADEQNRIGKEMFERKSPVASMGESHFFYRGSLSDDGGLIVSTALPNEADLNAYFAGERREILLIVLAIGIVITIFAYYTAQYFTRNINLLREFANRSANDPTFVPGTDYSHDELGDIARQIVQMFNERTQARKRIDHEHSVAIHAIEEKSRQKRQLTNNINHELKTPIGVIKGYLDTLNENPDLDPEIRAHFISKACDHANRLVELIADISAITRLEDGGNVINTESLNYPEIVYKFATDIRESGMLGSMEFQYKLPLQMPIRGNANLLAAMLMNLARNSANYSGGSICALENYDEKDPDFYHFCFYDDGSGVPEEALPRLFDRFYRVDSGRARKSGGTGLGLAIVYNTVTAHGGTISCANRPGAGLEIRFTLPKLKKATLV